ncbi:hypothetical protein Dsin_002721 [Dipteronia sinensis]|uniref:Fasciclin-like arabinogalactan protein 19 n=1 Tax=Dipteronia sinensis TaxID=43782 RepID=A0AAE0B7R3_9ROSI|nr:hypothetical protein Dsin_002721 [Dipteronia sinensis]
MAAHNTSFKILSLLTLLTLLSSSATVTAISTEDVDAVLLLLRAQGHALFANAISTSDLLFDILSLPSLTLLAPTDPTLFALDMTNTPPFYISTLRLHALPLRLSWSQLRLLSNGSLLPTLLYSHELLVLRRRQVNTFVVHGGGGGDGDSGSTVDVVMPGLYYSRDVAVHGLGGILTLRSKIDASANLSPPQVPSNNKNRTVFFPPVPRINTSSSGNSRNRNVFFPPIPRIPEILPINHTVRPPLVNRTKRSAPANNHTVSSPPSVNRTVVFQVPKFSTSNRTNHTDSSPVNRTAVVSPPPGPAVVENYLSSPIESPKSGDVLTWSSSGGLVLSPDNSPSLAPTRAEESKSKKIGEVLGSGEICAVG